MGGAAPGTSGTTAGRPPGLAGERLALRPDGPEDVQALAALMAEPAVARWWGRYDQDTVRRELGSGFVVVIDGRVEGWLHCHEEAAPDHPSVAFDIAIATEWQGKGYGPEALRVAIRHFIGRGHHRFTIDPAVDNERAIRAYRSVGFRPVGVLRRYERAPDGSWRDGLLMDLLASEVAG